MSVSVAIEQVKESTKTRVTLLVALLLITLIFISEIHGRGSIVSTNSQFEVRPNQAGRLGEEVGGNLHVQQVVDRIKPQLEQKSGLKFSSLEAISFRSQVVAGLNYFVKARGVTQSGDEKIVHLRIYNHWSDTLELAAFQLDKKLQDKIVYFQ